LMNYWENT